MLLSLGQYCSTTFIATHVTCSYLYAHILVTSSLDSFEHVMLSKKPDSQSQNPYYPVVLFYYDRSLTSYRESIGLCCNMHQPRLGDPPGAPG